MTKKPTSVEQARICTEAGLRVMPIRMPAKTPAVPKGSFGRYKPDFTVAPESFRPSDQIGILLGRVTHRADVELLGLDRDGAMTWAQLEQVLGQLPPTLSSKGDRHRFYWIPAGLDIGQVNGFLRCDGGAIDTRPNPGGYFREPWEWDNTLDLARVAYLPLSALAALQAAEAPHDDNEGASLPEPRELEPDEGDALLEALIAEFPPGGSSAGYHDACKATGGALRRAGASRDDTEALLEILVAQTGSTQPATRVEGGLNAWDRADSGDTAFGIPRLKELLDCEGRATCEALDAIRLITCFMQPLEVHETEHTVTLPAPAAPPDADKALEVLPAWVQAHVRAVREELRTPLDMNVANAVGALACAASGRIRVQVTPSYSCHVCQFVCTIAPPGELKSPAFNRALSPVKAWVRDKQAEGARTLVEQKLFRAALETKLKRLQKDNDRGRDPEVDNPLSEELLQVATQLEACPEPIPFEMLVEDCTPEMLSHMLAQQGGIVCASSDASKVFQVVSGKYSDKSGGDLQAWLKAFDGEAAIVHRMGRVAEKPRYPDRTTLSALLSIQPSVLAVARGNSDLEGQGMLDRFVWVQCASQGTRWTPGEIPAPLPQAVSEAYAAGVQSILNRPEATVRLSQGAYLNGYIAHRDEIEALRVGELSDMSGWLGKHLERVVRIAAVLWAADGAVGEVTLSQFARAVVIGRWALGHAVNVYMKDSEATIEGRIASCVLRRNITEKGPVTKRTVLQHARPRLKSKAMQEVLDDLVEHGTLVAVAQGRDRTPLYYHAKWAR